MSIGRFTPIEHCLACGGSELVPYLDLGVQPLANGFHDGSKVLPAYPLGLNVCPTCFHSQNVGAVDPAVLFTDYPYVSGTSETLRDYFFRFVKCVELDFKMTYSGSVGMHAKPERSLRVLDIASNDGSLLKQFKARGHYVRGVDPAQNLAALANAEGISMHIGFWDERMVESVQETDNPEWLNQFDVITAMNVLGHVQDPLKFLQLAKTVLAPGGRIYVQTSQADMVKNCEFDTCYHEHLSFFTARSFRALAMRAGLWFDKHEIVPIHGGSHLVCMRVDDGSNTFVAHVEDQEERDGLYDIGTYELFQGRANRLALHARSILKFHRDTFGMKLIAYGAAAKAMTFLNFSEASYLLEYVVDDNPLKIGKLCPTLGDERMVLSAETLAAEQEPLAIVITAWNFSAEIIAKVKRLRPGRDDTFITYFPNITIS